MDTQENHVFSEVSNIALLYGLGSLRESIKAIPRRKIEILFTQRIFQA